MNVKDVCTKVAVLVLWLLVGMVMQGQSASLAGLGSGFEGCVVHRTSTRMRDIGGLESIKRELYYGMLLPLRYPSVFFGGSRAIAACKGWLFSGPPGVGKTLLAKAVATETNATFFSVGASSLESKYYGDTAKLLRSLFASARERAPSIVFFDEIDGLCRTRGELDGCSYGLKTELLQCMDGVESSEKEAVVVVAATNRRESLDPALRRRLPMTIEFELPDREERRRILEITMRDEAEPARVDDAVLDATEGYSGSDLASLYKIASNLRFRRQISGGAALRGLVPLSVEDWLQAKRRVLG